MDIFYKKFWVQGKSILHEKTVQGLYQQRGYVPNRGSNPESYSHTIQTFDEDGYIKELFDVYPETIEPIKFKIKDKRKIEGVVEFEYLCPNCKYWQPESDFCPDCGLGLDGNI